MAQEVHTVLVADDGNFNGRSALAAVRALGEAGHRALVTVAEGHSLASSSRWCAGVVALPNLDPSGLLEAVTAAKAEANVSLVVPSSDKAVVALGLSGAELVDKRMVRANAAAVGLRVPDEQEFVDRAALEKHADDLPYPVVVKPAVRIGPFPAIAVRVDDASELGRVGLDQAVVVQPFLDGQMSAFGGLVLDGRLVAAVHQRYERIWPPVCGCASSAVTVEPDLKLEQRLLELVGGHEGIFQVQFLDDHVIDVNPRAYGSLPLAVRAGANLPALWCAAIPGGPPLGLPVRGRPGVRYRWLDADLRAVWGQVRAGEIRLPAAVRALTPRRGTAHSIEDWRDPKPLFVRMTQAGRRSP